MLHQPGASVGFETLGEVIGVHFSGENEMALFVPGSAELIVCGSDAWAAVRAQKAVPDTGSKDPCAPAGERRMEATSEDGLRDLFRTLGARLV